MASLWDRAYDYFTGGSKSNEDYTSALNAAQADYAAKMKAATDNYNTSVNDALASRKSVKDLNAEGKEIAATQANNKAGIAKKNAKAAAMQTNGSKLMAAIQGAQGAVDASQSGYDTAASNAMNMAQAQNNADIQNKINAAGTALNAAQNSAATAYDTAKASADNAAATASESRKRKDAWVNNLMGAGLSWLSK